MKLYSYWRSSSTWRVRIALHLKGIAHETVPVHLVRDGGEQHQDDHLARNPMAQVPVLETPYGTLSQSVAIIEWLDKVHPDPPLLPDDPWEKAQVRALVEAVNSGIQPIQNLSVLQHVVRLDGDKLAWGKHWIEQGLNQLEMLVSEQGPFCRGAQLTMADLYLIPQLYNARRFGCAMEEWPNLLAIEAECAALPSFQAAHPDVQVDAVR